LAYLFCVSGGSFHGSATVEVCGTGLALMNPLGSSPVNAVTTMGNLPRATEKQTQAFATKNL
jgi:hypothetical protein